MHCHHKTRQRGGQLFGGGKFEERQHRKRNHQPENQSVYPNGHVGSHVEPLSQEKEARKQGAEQEPVEEMHGQQEGRAERSGACGRAPETELQFALEPGHRYPGGPLQCDSYQDHSGGAREAPQETCQDGAWQTQAI